MNRDAHAKADAAALERAEALLDLKRWHEARELLQGLLAADPDNPETWALLAVAFLGADEPDRALVAAQQAVLAAPTHEWPWCLMSLALDRLGRRDEAVAAAREAVRFGPDIWATHAQLAHVLAPTRAGRREAHDAATRAVELAPDHPDAHLALAAALSETRRHEEAQAAVERALALDPGASVAHHELARAALGSRLIPGPRALARAADGFATAVQLDPRAGYSRHSLDVVIRDFLHRAAWLTLIGALIVYQVSEHSGHVPRALPLLVPVLPVAFVWRFLRCLPQVAKQQLLRQARTRPLVAPVGLVTFSLAFLGSSGLAPEAHRALLVGLAGTTALWARVQLVFELRRSARASRGLPPQHSFSGPSLILVAVCLALTGVTVGLGAQQHVAEARVAAAACVAWAAWLIRMVVLRRRPA